MLDGNRKTIIRQLIYTFGRYANIEDDRVLEDAILEFSSLNLDDLFDRVILTLDSFINRGLIKKEQILNNIGLILKLDNEKYRCEEDLLKRLKWLKEMNVVGAHMSLDQNHKLVLEVFYKFNKLLNGKFDCYYTGGLMGYLAANKKLERYHGDLDLFINEEELFKLKKLVEASDEFEFCSNLECKNVPEGHEYMIRYKYGEMDIGLFLFERMENEVVLKSYYYENYNLLVDERHLSNRYFELCFSDQLKYYNDSIYKMVSVENLYWSKHQGRPKDVYDANIIKDLINAETVNEIKRESKNNFIDSKKEVELSVINEIRKLSMKNRR